MRRARMTRPAWAVMVALAVGGCDDGGGGADPEPFDACHVCGPLEAGPPLDAATDARPDDADLPDAASDATSDADPPDAAPDAGCDFPAPRRGDAPPVAALAADPATCGQAPYTWLDDPALGAVVERVEVQRLSAAALSALAAAAGITIPRPFVADVVVEQIVYVTQARGERVEATALVATPQDPPADAPQAIFALLHGTAGFSDACAPSDDFQTQGLAAALAATGYTVVAPDYIGLKGRGEPTGFLHPYLIGEPTAMAVLDAIRAAGRLSAEAGGRCLPAEAVIVGGSQGGHAALWTELLAPYYADELTILGTVATVPPSDLLRQMELALTARIDATFNALALLITGADWYGHTAALGAVLRPPLDVDLPRAAAASCDGDDIDLDEADYPTLGDIFTPRLLDAVAAGELGALEPWGCFARENSLLHTRIARLAPAERPAHGILFVLGEADGLVDTPTERAAFDALCEAGWPLVYLECARAPHGPTTQWALPEILDFLDARRAGEPLADRCVRTPPSDCRGEPMR